jgi:uncharacterized protein (DUF1501 family)
MDTIKLTKRGFLAASAAAGLTFAMPAIRARAQTGTLPNALGQCIG